MNMNIWTIALYEIRRSLTTRTVVIVQFVLPLLLIFILGSALSGEFKADDMKLKPVQVALVQQDAGAMKGEFEAFLAASDIQSMIQISSTTTREEAEKQVKAGKMEFALVIPPNFSDNVTQGKPAEWEMILGKDYGQNLTAQLVFNSFLSHANQIQATMLTLGPTSAKTVNGGASSGNSFVKVGKLSATSSNFTSTQYYAAAMLVMFLLYSGLSAAISLLLEKERHTLARLNSLPIPEVHIILGKIIGNGLVAMFQAFIIIEATKVFYGVSWGDSYLLLFVVCAFIVIASMSLAVVASLLSRSSKAVTSILQMLIVVMTFLSGGFSPFPDGLLTKLGEFTVNHWALQSMLNIMLNSDIMVILHQIAVLAAIGAGLLVVSLAAYRKVGYHE
jgi:ABC-2 type transport system permease protein